MTGEGFAWVIFSDVATESESPWGQSVMTGMMGATVRKAASSSGSIMGRHNNPPNLRVNYSNSL